jgi:hypothetical protein
VEVDKIETGPVATTVTSYFEIYLIIASEWVLTSITLNIQLQ